MPRKLDTQTLTEPVEALAALLAQNPALTPDDLRALEQQGRRQAATLARAITFLNQTLDIEKSRHSIKVYNRKGMLKEIKF